MTSGPNLGLCGQEHHEEIASSSPGPDSKSQVAFSLEVPEISVSSLPPSLSLSLVCTVERALLISCRQHFACCCHGSAELQGASLIACFKVA